MNAKAGSDWENYTAVPYRASTGPEQGFPCVLILTGKNLFSLQGTPVLIAGILYSLQGIPCENYYTGKSLQSLQGMGLQCSFMFATCRDTSESTMNQLSHFGLIEDVMDMSCVLVAVPISTNN